jgi:hypothetical protein
MGLNPTWGMDVCVHLFWVCAVLCVGKGWSPAKKRYCVRDYETEKVTRAQQRAVEPLMYAFEVKIKIKVNQIWMETT